MEKTALVNATKTSISDVLETMFFLPIEISETEEDIGQLEAPENDFFLTSKLSFRGPFSGCFFFLIASKLALSLTASFLGEEESDVDDKAVLGTVKEILNMATGKSFSIFDDSAVFELGLPEIVDLKKVPSEGSEESADQFVLLIHTVDATSALKVCIFP